MSHYAKVENGIVTTVIVADENFINSGMVGDPSQWIQTSYNSNIRNMYAGVGYTYDKNKDVFYPPKPYPSWKLSTREIKKLDPITMDITIPKILIDWEAPTKMPNDGFAYSWNEEVGLWEEIIPPISGSI